MLARIRRQPLAKWQHRLRRSGTKQAGMFQLWAEERCSLEEIATFYGVSRSDVAATLRAHCF